MKTAIILGATGLTGGFLLRNLLEDERYEKIKVFSRSSVGFKHPKLEEHILDLFEIEKEKENFKGDEVHCCIGTTRKKTPDKDTYRKVDYGIPVAAARLAKRNHIQTFSVISALGANMGSKIFYNRIKGEMENDVLQEKIFNTFILRPSLIGGERKERRSFEHFAKKLMDLLSPVFIGPLKKLKSIHPQEIAAAMVYVANNGYPKTRINSKEIKDLAKIENQNARNREEVQSEFIRL